MLEDRTQAQHGSSVSSDLHQLALELREMKSDRERLLAVLGEKTREASSLRAEVHRLTSVAAASQAALTKAQHDAQQIASQSHQETNQDMKNEAVKKLSQMIKDKDVEISALRLKNATLVQVRCWQFKSQLRLVISTKGCNWDNVLMEKTGCKQNDIFNVVLHA